MIVIFVIRAFVLTLLAILVHIVYICEFSQNAVLITLYPCFKSSPCLTLKYSFLSLAFKIFSDLALTILSNISVSCPYSWLHPQCSPVVRMLLCPWGSVLSASIYTTRPSTSPHSLCDLEVISLSLISFHIVLRA